MSIWFTSVVLDVSRHPIRAVCCGSGSSWCARPLLPSKPSTWQARSSGPRFTPPNRNRCTERGSGSPSFRYCPRPSRILQAYHAHLSFPTSRWPFDFCRQSCLRPRNKYIFVFIFNSFFKIIQNVNRASNLINYKILL